MNNRLHEITGVALLSAEAVRLILNGHIAQTLKVSKEMHPRMTARCDRRNNTAGQQNLHQGRACFRCRLDPSRVFNYEKTGQSL